MDQCYSLLQQVVDPWFRNLPVDHKDLWYLSRFLYLWLVVAPMGKTLGMQATGLTVSSETKRRRFVTVLFLATSSLYLLDRWTQNNSGSNSNQRTSSANGESLRGDDRRRLHERLRQQMLNRTTHLTNAPTVGTSNGDVPIDSLFSRLRSFLKACAKVSGGCPAFVRFGWLFSALQSDHSLPASCSDRRWIYSCQPGRTSRRRIK